MSFYLKYTLMSEQVTLKDGAKPEELEK